MGIDHKYANEIVCPWCGYVHTDSWDIRPNEENIGLLHCEDCEKGFYAERNITIDYSTKKAKYGTCSKCGITDILRSGIEYNEEYTDHCPKCKEEHRRFAIKKFMKELEEEKTYGALEFLKKIEGVEQ